MTHFAIMLEALIKCEREVKIERRHPVVDYIICDNLIVYEFDEKTGALLRTLILRDKPVEVIGI